PVSTMRSTHPLNVLWNRGTRNGSVFSQFLLRHAFKPKGINPPIGRIEIAGDLATSNAYARGQPKTSSESGAPEELGTPGLFFFLVHLHGAVRCDYANAAIRRGRSLLSASWCSASYRSTAFCKFSQYCAVVGPGKNAFH